MQNSDCKLTLKRSMVSVCMATYNGAEYIRQQLSSITAQLGADDEVIVSDDGSTDSTLAVIRSMGDSRVKTIEGPRRQSPVWNFENALRHAKGDYIFLADQDDVWKPGKVSTMMEWLRRYDCVVSDAEMADRDLNIIRKSYYGMHGTKPGRMYNLLVKNGYMGCCMAFTRRVLDASLPFPKDTPMHDLWIGNVAAFRFSLKFIGDRLVTYRCHGGNASFTATGKSGYSTLRKLFIRLITVKNLLTTAR